MKNIKCLLSMHSYYQASTEVKVTDFRLGYMICRVRKCCINCEKAFENLVVIPLLDTDRAKMDEEEENI